MKILHVNTHDIQGGAARAAYRLHQGLRQIGQNSRMLARYKTSVDDSIIHIANLASSAADQKAFFLENVVQEHYIDTNRTSLSNTIFSLSYPGYDLSTLPIAQAAEIINLHWVAHFQSPVTLQRLFSLGKPVVWTLHDQCAFTGGCHYSAGCDGYRQNCAACPQLAETLNHLPGAVLTDKTDLWTGANLTIVSPSHWLAACAKESTLFKALRIEVIPNSVETDLFVPRPKAEAKTCLKLAADTVTLLFGAMDTRDKRKGFHHLLAAMQYCMTTPKFQQLVAAERLKILCFGYVGEELEATGLPTMSLGYLASDEQIALAYAAADLFILPSLEDNLPNTMLEAMSCGTPVVGFQVGGLPDLIENANTGQLVPLGDARQLGKAILSLLAAPGQLTQMGQNCRRLIETNYALADQAQRYLNLYRELLTTHSRSHVVAPAKNTLLKPAELVTEYLATIETDLGFCFQSIYNSVLSQALQEYAPLINRKWQVAEADRVAQLEVIHRLRTQLEASEADRVAQLEVIHQLRNQLDASEAGRTARLDAIHILQEQLAASETDRVVRAYIIEKLERDVAGLSSAEGALGRLFSILARKLGLYPFFKRHEQFLRGVYRTLHNRLAPHRPIQPVGQAAQPVVAEISDQTLKKDIQTFVNSPLTEAFVAARALGGDIDERLLIDLYELGPSIHHVLCVQPTDRDIQALYMLSRAGAKVTCVDCQVRQVELQTCGFVISPVSLNEWLLTISPADLDDVDALWLGDRPPSQEMLSWLKGRLGPRTKLLLASSAAENLPWGLPERMIHGLAVYPVPLDLKPAVVMQE